MDESLQAEPPAHLVRDGECGIAAVELVARYFGLEPSKDVLAPLNQDGATLGEISDALQALGLRVHHLQADAAELGKCQGARLIVIPPGQERAGHLFVSFQSQRTSEGTGTVIIDPTGMIGESPWTAADVVHAGWTGSILEITPAGTGAVMGWLVALALGGALGCGAVNRFSRRLRTHKLTANRA